MMNIFPFTALRQEHSRIIRRAFAEMERTMHHREGELRSVSSTADDPMDEKICEIKRSNPPPDWPSSVCPTRSLPGTVTTGVTPQEETMSCQDADQLPYTRCLHGKRPCHQLDVNRRCIPSITAAMTDDSKERFPHQY